MSIPTRLMATVAAAIALLCGPSLAAPGAHGPGGEHLDSPAIAGATGLARLADGSVNIPKQAQRRMSIRTVVGHEADHALAVELNGKIAIDPNAGGRVQAPFSGRIEPGPKGLPVAGQSVTKGQVLLYLRPVSGAIERGNQRAQLSDLRANVVLARQRVKRLESLEGSVPRKEIDAARAELQSLIGRERAISTSLDGNEAITASASGIIASAGAIAGQIVDAQQILYEIVDPDRMIVEATTTDVSLAQRLGKASLAGMPGAELELLGAGRSLKNGALPLSFRIRGKGLPLAVGQPVTVIASVADKVKGIALPSEAVVRSQSNERIVWIKAGAERFIAQPVEFQPLDADTVLVVKGLGPDNRVVTSGAALLNQIR